MVVCGEPDQRGPHERPLPEAERPVRLFDGKSPRLLVPLFLSEVTDVNDRKRQALPRVNDLNGFAIHYIKMGSQSLVTPRDFRQAVFQNSGIQAPTQAHDRGRIVERIIRLELVEEPEPLLCE